MMVGREINDLYGKRRIEQGDAVLAVRSLTTEDGTGLDASFEVRRARSSGSRGSSAAARTSSPSRSAARPSRGDVLVRGRSVRLRSPGAAMGAGISLVPDDRKRNAILPTRSVQHNLSAAWIDAALAAWASSTRAASGGSRPTPCALRGQDGVARDADREPLGREPAEGRPRPAGSRCRRT